MDLYEQAKNGYLIKDSSFAGSSFCYLHLRPASPMYCRRFFITCNEQSENERLFKGNSRPMGIFKLLTFHIARHTFATTITLNNDVPIESVAKIMGHTSIKTTQIYAKVMDYKISSDMQQLRKKLVAG